MRHLPPRLSDQGRHPSDAYRRSDGRKVARQSRGVKILFVRLRQIGDVVFTTPAVHAVRDRFPDADLSYLVEPAAAPVVQANPWLQSVIVAPRQSGLRGFLNDL